MSQKSSFDQDDFFGDSPPCFQMIKSPSINFSPAEKDYTNVKDDALNKKPLKKTNHSQEIAGLNPFYPPQNPPVEEDEDEDVLLDVFGRNVVSTSSNAGRNDSGQIELGRNYDHSITGHVVRMACNQISQDILAKKGAKIRCMQLGVEYSEFKTLLRQIQKDNHISNKRLLTCYLQPEESDPQFKAKIVFAEYLEYFLRNCLNVAVRKSTKIKDKSKYIDYVRRHLIYLVSAINGPGNIRQDNPMESSK